MDVSVVNIKEKFNTGDAGGELTDTDLEWI
jgi:hypothetical protein